MGRWLVLGYGVMAYGAFLAAFTVLGDFVAIGYVRSINAGQSATPAVAAAIDLGLIALFGVSHSVMARASVKRQLTRIIPASAERSTYVLVSSLTLALMVWQWRPIPDLAWYIDELWLRRIVWTVHALGLALIVFSTFLTDHFDLFGLRQTWLHARGRPYTPVPFIERSLYRFVRHPMMLGMIVWLWAAPTMTYGRVLLAGTLTMYILVGIAFEEKSLERELGQGYADYRRRVPALVPRLRV
jgi:methanethiol S-methyltransferase